MIFIEDGTPILRRFRSGLLCLLPLIVIGVAIVWLREGKVPPWVPGQSAEVLFELREAQPPLLFDTGTSQDAFYEVYQRSQASAVRSQFVIQRALEKDQADAGKSESELPGLDHHWIQAHLAADFPERRILRVRLRGLRKPVAEKLLGAIAAEYLDQEVGVERRRRETRLDKLRTAQQRTENDISAREQEQRLLLARLASDEPNGPAAEADRQEAVRVEAKLEALDKLRKGLAEELRKTATELVAVQSSPRVRLLESAK